MRARTYKAAHRNLADSKRSIVMMCAGLAMILGTTSVGASMFSFGNDSPLIERTGTSMTTDANGDNEVIIDEPTIQTLQGQTIAIPRKPQSTLQVAKQQPTLNISTIVTTPLLNHLTATPTPTVPAEVATQPNPTPGTGSTNPGTTNPDPGDDGTNPDPNGNTGSGNSGEIIEDDDKTTDGASQTRSGDTQQPATNPPLQGS